MARVKELDFSNLKEEYTFEDFCNKKYINQVPAEELRRFAVGYFLRDHLVPGVKPLEVTFDDWDYGSEIKLDDSFRDKGVLVYYLDDRNYENNYGNGVTVRFDYEEPNTDWSTNQMYFACGCRYMGNRKSFCFSDYTMEKPLGLFLGYWDFEPSYFKFMYNKFGDEYVKDFLTTRKFYRDYYVARETAKKNEAIRVMKENEPIAYNLEKVKKTTDTFIDSTPIDVVDTYFSREISGKNYVIDVTNFQTLKNEDIPEDRKDGGRTMLRRIRSHKKAGAIESVYESQWREPITRWNGYTSYREYPKKNQPVIKYLYEFNDFDFKCDGRVIDAYDVTANWRGCMYGVFGDEYEEALEKQYDDKLSEWIEKYDAKTRAISEFLSQNCGGMQSVNGTTPLISEETPAD